MKTDRLAERISEAPGYGIHDRCAEQSVQHNGHQGSVTSHHIGNEQKEVCQKDEHEARLPRELPDHKVGKLVPPWQGSIRLFIDAFGAVRNDR